MNNITGEKMLEEMTKLNPSDLKEETRDLFNTIMRIIDEKEELYEENKSLDRKIQIKDKYLDLIIAIGYDYDGFNKVESLKGLIDELVRFAKMALDNDDRTSIAIDNNDKKMNILGEIIESEAKHDN